MKMRDKDGKTITKTVKLLEDEPEEEEPVWEYVSGRVVTVSRFTGKEDHVTVGVTPDKGQYWINIPWVPDTGVKKSMLSEHHMKWVLKKNPEALIKENYI